MTAAAPHALKPHLTREHLLHLLRQMIRIRRFEERCVELYQQEKIRGFLHVYIGEEAVAAGVLETLEAADTVSPPTASTAMPSSAASRWTP